MTASFVNRRSRGHKVLKEGRYGRLLTSSRDDVPGVRHGTAPVTVTAHVGVNGAAGPPKSGRSRLIRW